MHLMQPDNTAEIINYYYAMVSLGYSRFGLPDIRERLKFLDDGVLEFLVPKTIKKKHQQGCLSKI